jgi:Zn-dependent protease
MAESLTRDAREIVDRATALARTRGVEEPSAVDLLKATLQSPRSLADSEIKALGADPQALASALPANGAQEEPSLRHVIANANREAQVLGHYRIDSVHLLLALMYSDSPATAIPLQNAGLTLYNLRSHLQGVEPERALRRKPWPSLRGVVSVSPFFLAVVGVLALSGALLWTGAVPGQAGLLVTAFVVAGWVASLCLHEFGHAIVAYLGGDRSVVGAGYLSLNPLRYQSLMVSLILPIVFLLIGGIALPGGAVYINHSALRTRAWSTAVSLAGPAANLLCALLIGGVFLLALPRSSLNPGQIEFFGALAVLGFFMAFAVVINLLPVPGLDGFGAIRPWLPYSVQYSAVRYGTIGIYAVFLALWFVPPVRQVFFQLVYQLTALVGIPQLLIAIGYSSLRLL